MSKLKVASCQFPVTEDIKRNSEYIRNYLKRAAEEGAHLLHTSEACLSGYAGAGSQVKVVEVSVRATERFVGGDGAVLGRAAE